MRWLVKCASGREFVVYGNTENIARGFFDRWNMGPAREEIASIAPYVEGPVTAIVDARKAPGA